MKLAIVGGGPRCVVAMESLIAERGDDLPELLIFEPHDVVGPGWAYDPRQPEWNRLNVAADAILPATATSPRFSDWLRTHHPRSDQQFPPRALAGRYLAGAAIAAADRYTTVRHVRERVHDVTPSGTRWVVNAAAHRHTVDAVLLVTGHTPRWSGRLAGATPAYPQTYAAGPLPDTIAIRGAALTAIDATLACTQGAGGRFTTDPRRPHSVAYLPGPDGARRIRWSSRSGRPMCAKTDRAVLAAMEWLPRSARSHAADLTDLPAEVVVHDIATEILDRVGGNDAGRPDDAESWLEVDLSIAHGARPPDRLWAEGQGWRALYPHLIERHLGLQRSGAAPPEGWVRFAAFSRGMEPLAFGPPAINAEKVLALVRAGILTIDAGPLAEADLVIDAVLPPAGLPDATDALWRSLLSQGLVEPATDRSAVAIDLDATAVVRGERREGLAVFGRAAEGVVLGTDTLNHELHPHLRRWAATVGSGRRRTTDGPAPRAARLH